MRKWCSIWVVAALAAGLIVLAAPTPANAADGSAESAFVSRINSLRTSKGLAPLQVDSELTGVARNWTDQMVDAGQISHNPNLANDVHQYWIKLGENVGVGANVDQLMQAFINSPSHYRNLVNPDYNYVGVGVSYDAAGRMYTTHDFMMLQDGPVASAPASSPRGGDEPAPPPPPPTPPATPERVKTMLAVLHRVDLLDDPAPQAPQHSS